MAVEVYSRVHEVLKGIHNGTFFRIGYYKEIPVSKRRCKEASIDPNEVKIYKIVTTTVRTGVAYHNIRRVADKLQDKVEDKKPRVNNYTWIEKNICKFNTNTAKFYLCCATIPQGGNCQVSYSVNYNGKLFTYSKDGFEDSEFYDLLNDSDKAQKNPCEYFTLSYENILSVNGKSVH